jgi:hypothetical protein
MRDFINAFKKTSYYQGLFNSSEVLLIYLAGSINVGITDGRSDYDIVILTSDSEHIYASRYEYLLYNGKKVHWYYRSIKHFFEADHKDSLAYIGTMLVRNIREDLIIYKNPKYSDTLQKLYEIKDRLSALGIYRLFEVQKAYIDEILNNGKVLEKHHTKYLYHLSLASYYLTGEELDKDFLRVLKRIRTQSVPEEYKQLAIERLKIYKNYINSHPSNIRAGLQALYKELMLCE